MKYCQLKRYHFVYLCANIVLSYLKEVIILNNNTKNTGLSELEHKIAARIKDERIKNGFTQKEIAAYLNVSTAAYTNYENAKRSFPHDILLALSSLLAININYIYTGITYQNPYMYPADSIDFDIEHNKWVAIKNFFEYFGYHIDTRYTRSNKEGFNIELGGIEYTPQKFEKLLSMINNLINDSIDLVEPTDYNE